MKFLILKGILSIFHISFLPGFLLLRVLRTKDWFFVDFVYAFGISMVINYFLVVLLTASGLYFHELMLALVILEIGLTIWIVGKRRYLNAEGSLNFAATSVLSSLLILLSVFYYLPLFGQAATSVFTQWDAVFSWNRWAMDWTKGIFPRYTMNYPQLLPIAWASTYVTIGEPIQFFAHGVMPFFSLGTIFLMIGLAQRTGNFCLFTAPLIFTWLLSSLYAPFLTAGYADIPVAFFALAAFYPMFLLASGNDVIERKQMLVLISLSAVGSALTKQAGLFVAILAPFLLYYFGVSRHRFRPLEALWLSLSVAIVIMLAIGSWYIYKQWLITSGLERNISAYLVGEIHEGRDYWERIAYGFRLIVEKVGMLPLMLILGFMLLSMLDSTMRLFTLFFSLGYPIIWSIFFSYDLRNLALAIPFVSMTAASGLSVILRHLPLSFRKVERLLENHVKRPSSWKPYLPWLNSKTKIVAIAGTALLTIGLAPNDNQIRKAHDAQLRQLGVQEFNNLLYEYDRTQGLQGQVLTNYRFMEFLPDLSDHYLPFYRIVVQVESRPFWSIQNFDAWLSDPSKEICHIFLIIRENHRGVPVVAIQKHIRDLAKKEILKIHVDTEKYSFATLSRCDVDNGKR